MQNIINIKKVYEFKEKFLFIFLSIFIPRLIYILLFDNYTTDSYNYLRIADNIGKGCGFAFTNSSGECVPLVGTAFPGYHFFIYFLKFIGFSDKFIPLLVLLFTTLSFIYLISSLNDLGLNGKKFYVFTSLFSLSPLSIGYSRFINMDPILYIFSLIIITEIIKLKTNPIFFREISFRILTYIVIAIYIKPTSIVLILPYFLMVIIHFGVKKFIKSFISFFLIITLSILPWGLRDIKLGADMPFRSCGNQLGYNACELSHWLSSFALTEYEYASVVYPLYDRENGNRKNVKILTRYNPLISKTDFDYIEINKILQKENPEFEKGFTDDEKKILNNFAEVRFRNNGPIGNLFLFTFKYISLLLHPLTSWGLPISVGENSKFSFSDISQMYKLFLKGLFFVYRVIIFCFYFKNVFSLFSKFNPANILSKRNLNIIKENTILISSFTILISNFFIYVNMFDMLQHRYFYALMPWIELMVFFEISKSQKINLKVIK